MSIYEENSVLRLLNHYGNIDLERFSDRLRLQKLAFLSQELGLGNEFSFTYYHYGPYSPTLTKLLYKGYETQAFPEQIQLTEQEQRIVQRIGELMGEQINDVESLELFATIWYLTPSREISDTERQDLIVLIQETKPRFRTEQIQAAMNRIIEFRRNHGFFNP